MPDGSRPHLQSAPFHADVCRPGTAGSAVWVRTADGIRLRLAFWSAPKPRGTLLLFPGRTEYVEKYAQVGADLARRGYATLVIDWRGQGLADRLIDDPIVGHVDDFAEYQIDVAAGLAAADEIGLPPPWHVLGHSMGGCIALRALYNGLPVASAVFSGPMWGIKIAPHLRLPAWVLTQSMPRIGLGTLTPPGYPRQAYTLVAPFEDNLLTRDNDSWDLLARQVREHPALALGAPSYRWVREATRECDALSRMAPLGLPGVTYLGTNERIVDVPRIHARMDRWPNGDLELIVGGEHETLMEDDETRGAILDDMVARMDRVAGGGRAAGA